VSAFSRRKDRSPHPNPSPGGRGARKLPGARLGTLTRAPLPEGEGLGSARIFPLYLRERGTEGVREPRRRQTPVQHALSEEGGRSREPLYGHIEGKPAHVPLKQLTSSSAAGQQPAPGGSKQRPISACVPQAVPGQSASPRQDWQVPLAQTPLKQSAATAQSCPILRRQRLNWHSPPMQSLFCAQGVPVRALQAAESQSWLGQSLLLVQGAHTPAVQRPLAHASLTAQGPLRGARQSSTEQSRQVCDAGSQVGVGPAAQSASLAQRLWPLLLDIGELLDSPPSPVSKHWRRSRQGSGAKRHAGAPAASPSARELASKAPGRALGRILTAPLVT
jgi:hypothetical protein